MASNCSSSSAAAGTASKTKTKKKHFVCQKVKLFRASEPLLSVLMWGVNHTINELSNVPVPVMLMPDDFKAYSKIKVDNHLFNKENLPSRFKFKEYCPMVFRNLRERFGIDDQDYQNSLTRSAPVNSENQGRFGSRFLTTFDRRFVIKTISSEDVAEMHNILKKYHQFIVECHGNTLLPQFLGMYRLTVDGVETYMVVTRNVFSHRLGVHRKYDLKGSTVSREASDKEKAKDLPTFKDNDFLNEGQKLRVGEENKKIFLEKLKRDVEFYFCSQQEQQHRPSHCYSAISLFWWPVQWLWDQCHRSAPVHRESSNVLNTETSYEAPPIVREATGPIVSSPLARPLH